MKEKWFVPSLKDDYEVIIYYDDQKCPSAKYLYNGWTKTTLRKVENIINAVESTIELSKQGYSDIFIYADIDIQFFQRTQNLILKYMQNQDMVFQRDTPKGAICSGFFACRASKKTLAFWNGVKQRMMKKGCSDQPAVNTLLRVKNPYNISWDYLPKEFFGGGTISGKYWTPGKRLAVPYRIVLHHANWTTGIENKIKQLKYVRKIVNQRRNEKKKFYNA